VPESVRIWGPGSLSNLGPGFDTLGMAIDGVGDVVEVFVTDEPGVTVHPGGGVWEPPTEVMDNTAARAVARIVEQHPNFRHGLGLRIVKGIRPGSGLGSSAASASAAALGALLILSGGPKSEAVDAALEGESGVSGARHGDNVLPSLFGGAVLTSASNPERYRLVPIPCEVHFAVVRPDVRVLTKEARAMLPDQVPLRDAVHNASALAFLIDALRSGDLGAFGHAIEQDRLVEPVRARLVPGYDQILGAAREAGALGAALTGSGPAMFAVASDRQAAESVCQAMLQATRDVGHQVSGLATSVDLQGARPTTLEKPESYY
jgi:homoserine kinase